MSVRVRPFASLIVTSGVLSSAAAAQKFPPVDPSATQVNEAYVTAVEGRVSVDRDARVWALSTGERVPIQRMITTGPDGYARFELHGGANFEIFANSRVGFRQNAADAGDLLDIFAGRVRVHFNPEPGRSLQRVFCPIATISAAGPAMISVAVDEDDQVRLDVLEGEVRAQHKLLPRSEPTVVRAVDAILIEKDEKIVRRLDRGTLYRYAVKLHELFSAVMPGHGGQKSSGPVEQQLLAWVR
jgi:hypothetical protein